MNNLRFAAGLLGLGVLGGLSSCEKKPAAPAPEQTVEVVYKQTYCADPWGGASTAQQLEAAAGTYLQQQGIVATDVLATATNPAQVCNACHCKSGVVLQANVRQQDVAAVLALGFVRK